MTQSPFFKTIYFLSFFLVFLILFFLNTSDMCISLFFLEIQNTSKLQSPTHVLLRVELKQNLVKAVVNFLAMKTPQNLAL